MNCSKSLHSLDCGIFLADGSAASSIEMTQALTPAAKALTDVEKDTDLPRALVKKIVKNKVNQTLAAAAPGEPLKDIQINKDALIAFSESAKVRGTSIRRDPMPRSCL